MMTGYLVAKEHPSPDGYLSEHEEDFICTYLQNCFMKISLQPSEQIQLGSLNHQHTLYLLYTGVFWMGLDLGSSEVGLKRVLNLLPGTRHSLPNGYPGTRYSESRLTNAANQYVFVYFVSEVKKKYVSACVSII